MFRLIRTKKGQAVLEYVIVLTAVVAAFVAISKIVKTNVETSFIGVTNKATGVVDAIQF